MKYLFTLLILSSTLFSNDYNTSKSNKYEKPLIIVPGNISDPISALGLTLINVGLNFDNAYNNLNKNKKPMNKDFKHLEEFEQSIK